MVAKRRKLSQKSWFFVQTWKHSRPHIVRAKTQSIHVTSLLMIAAGSNVAKSAEPTRISTRMASHLMLALVKCRPFGTMQRLGTAGGAVPGTRSRTDASREFFSLLATLPSASGQRNSTNHTTEKRRLLAQQSQQSRDEMTDAERIVLSHCLMQF